MRRLGRQYRSRQVFGTGRRLTEKGGKLAERALREDMAHETELLAGVSEDVQARLETLLRELALTTEAPPQT